MSLLAELRRRNVIRMAGLYLVGAWLIVQVAATLLPVFEAPSWVMRALVGLLAAGFVAALVFSWVFELTPDGLKRDGEVPAGETIAPQTGRRMDRMIIVVLALALGYFAVDRFVLVSAYEEARVPPVAGPDTRKVAPIAAIAGIDPKSIAVLPFADFSPDGDQGWFADGLAEEILNALGRTPDLLVSARTSSFRFRGSELAVPEIARELGVAHVLEGSVRSTPERIRVSAQLIRAADGFEVWSQTYDRASADMIGIQEDLAREIATAMQTSMDPEALAAMAAVGTRSVEAYQAFVRGVAARGANTPGAFKDAYGFFERAREIDPTFADAHERAASFWQVQLTGSQARSGLTDATPEEMSQRFQERIGLAIANASNEVDRLYYRAAQARHELRLRESVNLMRQLITVRPGRFASSELLIRPATQLGERRIAAEALAALWPQALVSEESAGLHATFAYRNLDSAVAAQLARELVDRWPLRAQVLYQAHRALLWDGRVEEAADVLQRFMESPDGIESFRLMARARQACAEGRRMDAEAALLLSADAPYSVRWQILTLLGRSDEATTLLKELERSGNLTELAEFLVHRQFDPSPFASLVELLARENAVRHPAIPEPFACAPIAQGSDG